MKKLTLALAAVTLLGAAPAFAGDSKPDGKPKHEMKMKGGMKHGKMECCKTDKDGKKTCKKMDHGKMNHSKMDHSKKGHGKTKSQ